jgi:hypothetical protein
MHVADSHKGGDAGGGGGILETRKNIPANIPEIFRNIPEYSGNILAISSAPGLDKFWHPGRKSKKIS